MGDPTAEFLDEAQYTRASIEAYEVVYGADFVSPGGAATAAELLADLGLGEGHRVLDVGCGLGGNAFWLAREFGARVDGIDLSTNMVAMARERMAAHGLGGRVTIEHADALELEAEGVYDLVHAREVFLHVHDKDRLFANLHRALRPGGRLLFTDYACGSYDWSEGFRGYVEQFAYRLHTLEDYVGILEGAGFAHVQAEDRTELFLAIHRRELAELEAAPSDDPHHVDLVEGWRAKIARAEGGEQRWVLVRARRD